MKAVNMESDQWQLGKSKVFIKAPESVRDCRVHWGHSYSCVRGHCGNTAWTCLITFTHSKLMHSFGFNNQCQETATTIPLVSRCTESCEKPRKANYFVVVLKYSSKKCCNANCKLAEQGRKKPWSKYPGPVSFALGHVNMEGLWSGGQVKLSSVVLLVDKE